MTAKPTLLCTLAALVLLGGCGKEEAPAALSCESPEVLNLLKTQIQTEAAARAAAEADGLPGGHTAEAAAAAMTALNFGLDGIRTTQALSASNQTLGCEATLRLNPAADAVKRLEEAFTHYMTVHETDGVDMNGVMSGSNNWLQADSAGGYVRKLSYTVQTAENGAKAVVNIDAKTAAAAIALPLRFYLAHPLLSRQAQAVEQQAASDAARQQELDTLNQAQLQARLDAARSANESAHGRLNQLWQSLPPDTRTALQEPQQQWNRVRETECAYYGKSESVEPLEQEALRLECDTQRVELRLTELAQQAESGRQQALADAQRRNQAADREIRRVWQSIPDDVKAIIGQDYQNWNSAVAAKCSAAEGQLAQLECETAETLAKIKELNGYIAN